MRSPSATWATSSVCCFFSIAAKRVLMPYMRYRRSEEHTSELQSLTNLVCRLLLEKKKKTKKKQKQALLTDTYITVAGKSHSHDLSGWRVFLGSCVIAILFFFACSFFFFLRNGPPPDSSFFPPTPLFRS